MSGQEFVEIWVAGLVFGALVALVVLFVVGVQRRRD